METLVTVIHVLVALFMILVVLIQGGNQGGVGAAFGGGNSQGVFGASGATSLLGKLTYAAAAVFMVTSMGLHKIQGGASDVGAVDDIKKKAEELQKKEEAAKPAGSSEDSDTGTDSAGSENQDKPESSKPEDSE